MTEGAERIKSGDLTEPITVLSNDEIGRVSESFNEMSDSLRLVLLRLDDSISQVAASSQELLANSAHNTASSEQIARAVDQMAVSADGSKRQPGRQCDIAPSSDHIGHHVNLREFNGRF